MFLLSLYKSTNLTFSHNNDVHAQCIEIPRANVGVQYEYSSVQEVDASRVSSKKRYEFQQGVNDT